MLNLLYKITDGDFTKPLPDLKMYDNDTVSITVDFTGTGFETYIKRIEFVNSAGVSSFVEKYNKKNKVKKLTQEERILRIEELLGL